MSRHPRETSTCTPTVGGSREIPTGGVSSGFATTRRLDRPRTRTPDVSRETLGLPIQSLASLPLARPARVSRETSSRTRAPCSPCSSCPIDERARWRRARRQRRDCPSTLWPLPSTTTQASRPCTQRHVRVEHLACKGDANTRRLPESSSTATPCDPDASSAGDSTLSYNAGQKGPSVAGFKSGPGTDALRGAPTPTSGRSTCSASAQHRRTDRVRLAGIPHRTPTHRATIRDGHTDWSLQLHDSASVVTHKLRRTPSTGRGSNREHRMRQCRTAAINPGEWQ